MLFSSVERGDAEQLVCQGRDSGRPTTTSGYGGVTSAGAGGGGGGRTRNVVVRGTRERALGLTREDGIPFALPAATAVEVPRPQARIEPRRLVPRDLAGSRMRRYDLAGYLIDEHALM